MYTNNSYNQTKITLIQPFRSIDTVATNIPPYSGPAAKMIKGADDWNKSGLFNAAFLLCVSSQIKGADCVICQNIL